MRGASTSLGEYAAVLRGGYTQERGGAPWGQKIVNGGHKLSSKFRCRYNKLKKAEKHRG